MYKTTMSTFLIFNNCVHLNNVLPRGQLCRLRPHHGNSVPDLHALNVTLFRCRDNFYFYFLLSLKENHLSLHTADLISDHFLSKSRTSLDPAEQVNCV